MVRNTINKVNSQIELKVEETGLRLDKYVSLKVPDLSRTRTQKLIEDGYIIVDGKTAKSSRMLAIGETVKIEIPAQPSLEIKAEDIHLNIIYEDADLLVVDKPAGMTVHPAPGHYSGTLVNAILAHVPGLEAGESLRPGIVHRLDKDTSGLILVAKNPAAHMKLAAQFKNRTVNKLYQTLVRGPVKNESGIIDAQIGRDPRARQRMAVVAAGRSARTEYHVLSRMGDYTLLEVRLHTGRTHQIRVHLAAIGNPVVGDNVYGARSNFINRQFLHAFKLGFKLPSSGEYREFTSPLPDDLTRALREIEASIKNC